MYLFIEIIAALFGARGFRYMVTENGMVMRNTESFLWLVVMFFFICVIDLSLREKNKRLSCFSALFGIICAVFYILGICLDKLGRISWLWSNSGILLNVLNLFYSHTLLYYCFAFLAFRFLQKQACEKVTERQSGFSLIYVFLIWAVLILLYLPWYCYCFPGVITQDSAEQLQDAVTVDSVHDHHSAFLSLIMRIIILPVRKLTGSLQIGVGAVSLLQMLIVTFIFALAYEWLRYYLKNKVLRIILFSWFAYYPVHYFYAATLWKDILFSVVFLAFMLCIDVAAVDEKGFFSSPLKMVLLAVSMLLLLLMRHNGLSIVVIMTVCLFLRFPAYRGRIALITGGLFLVFGVWNLLILPALNVTKIDSTHALSVMEQQMARVMYLHHEEFSDEEMAEFTEYFDIEDLWTRYKPYISDSVKRHFRNDLFAENPKGFFEVWMKLGKCFPVDYLEAFLANNYGYWFPEIRHTIISYGVNEMGAIEDIHSAPLLQSHLFDQVRDYIMGEQYMKMPLIPVLFSGGACFWVWVFCGCYCLYNNRRKFILFLPGFSLWLGILISPVVNEYRYVYGLFTALPLLMTSSLSGGDQPTAGSGE